MLKGEIGGTEFREVPDSRELEGDLLLLGNKPVFLDPQLRDFRVQR